ncbi:MAG TPA: putative metal-dependent hydrolase [Bacteroidia bacterium]|nr:putative metal-dependent hydrolase [Bacteroidia bacterium]
MSDAKLRFPVGRFEPPKEFNPEMIPIWIGTIRNFPETLEQTIQSYSPKMLDTPYRKDGWTVRQVVHHLGDSHLNSLVRFKLALTEEEPVIKAYLEDKWVRLPDGNCFPVHSAISFLGVLHARWVCLLEGMSENDFKRSFMHPEHGRLVSLYEALALYAWHCNHHLAHILLVEQQLPE